MRGEDQLTLQDEQEQPELLQEPEQHEEQELENRRAVRTCKEQPGRECHGPRGDGKRALPGRTRHPF
jgi:hypothetical protein